MQPRVFISYSSRDAEPAQATHQRLEKAGFSVWRDRTRLEREWPREIALALAQSDVICLLWSVNAAESKWVKHEWLTARALEKRIIPIFLPAHSELPEPLQPLDGVTFTNRQARADKLLEKLAAPGPFRMKYEYTMLPKRSFIPFNPNPEFVGRDSDLLELYLKLIGNLKKIGINHVGTMGLGGVGKTQLAIEFAHRFSFAFDAVFWIDATDSEQWRQQLVSLARDRLGLRVAEPESASAALQWMFALQSYCKNNPDMLVVMDNVADPKLLNSEQYLASGITALSLGVNLLFTTRRSFQLPGVVPHAVGALSPEASYELLTARRKPASDQEIKSAQDIAAAVGQLALAIVLIAAYLGKLRAVTFSDYREALLQRKLGSIDLGVITKEELATRHEAAVGATLDAQWRAVTLESGRLLFKLAGLFPEGAIIPKARLGLFAGIAPSRSPLERPLDLAFLELEELHLVEAVGRDERHVGLHPLVRAFSAGLLDASETNAKKTGTESLASAYADPFRLEAEWRTRGLEEVIGDLRAAISFGGDPGKLGVLERLVNRERHNLARGDERPGLLFQQLHYRAQMMGAAGLARDYFRALTAEPGVRLHMRAANPLEDSALAHELRGHTNEIRGVAFLDETRAATASWDINLMIWNVDNGEALRVMNAHSSVVEAFAVTPDGLFALTASDDHTVIVWDLGTGRAIHRLLGHREYIFSVAVTPDARRAASISRDCTLIYWDLQKGTAITIRDWPGALGDALNSRILAIRADGDLILSAPNWESGSYHLLAIDKQGRIIRTLEGHSGLVQSVAFAQHGTLALSGDHRGEMILWETETLTRVKSMRSEEPGEEPIYAIAFSADAKHAIAGSGNNLIYWNLETGRPIRTLRAHATPVEYAAISPHSRLVISAGRYARDPIVWDLTVPAAVDDPSQHAAEIEAISFDAQGQMCASIDESSKLVLWTVPEGKYIRDIHAYKTRVKATIDWGARRMLSTVGAEAELSDLETGQEIRTLKFANDVHSQTLSPGARYAYFSFAGSPQGQVSVIDCETGQPGSPVGFGGEVHYMSITADGGTILIASDYGLMIVWDLLNSREIIRHEGAKESLTAMCIESSGRYAVTATRTNVLSVWDLKTGVPLRNLFVPHRVTAVAMSGARIVLGDALGRISFLELEIGA